MKLKRSYDFYFFTVDTRDFVRIQFEDWKWSDWWYHNDKNCWCWDYNIIIGMNTKRVALWEKFTFRSPSIYLSCGICYILWIITMYLIL